MLRVCDECYGCSRARFMRALEFMFESHENPFASGKRTFDAKEEEEEEGAQIVTTNQYIHAFRGE